jgi:hypothetical protein
MCTRLRCRAPSSPRTVSQEKLCVPRTLHLVLPEEEVPHAIIDVLTRFGVLLRATHEMQQQDLLPIPPEPQAAMTGSCGQPPPPPIYTAAFRVVRTDDRRTIAMLILRPQSNL